MTAWGDDLYYYTNRIGLALLGKWCVVWNGNVGIKGFMKILSKLYREIAKLSEISYNEANSKNTFRKGVCGKHKRQNRGLIL